MKRLLDDAGVFNENWRNVKDGILVCGTGVQVVDLEEAVSASVFRQKSKWGESSIFTFFYEGRKKTRRSPSW